MKREAVAGVLAVYVWFAKLVFYIAVKTVLLPLRFLFWICRLTLMILIWPFRSKVNFGKFLVMCLFLLYFWTIEKRIYVLAEKLGGYGIFYCDENKTRAKLTESVVRIVGGYSEGSGFFVDKDKVMTNFHVIDGEAFPKVILSSGKVLVPNKITAYKDADLAILYIDKMEGDLIFGVGSDPDSGTRVLSAGYPMGTDIVGKPTITSGSVNGIRKSSKDVIRYIQTDISLVKGMSGGPLVDTCGNLVGVNTLSVAGLSFFVSEDSIDTAVWNKFSDADITKLEVDPTKSPDESVRAFYVYLKARKMKEGFDLLSEKYLEKTNYEEWTNRFVDVIDVDVISTKMVEKTNRMVAVKFTTNNWDGNEAALHYYEGTWETVWEDGKYKMLRSMIKEVEKPDWSWFYE